MTKYFSAKYLATISGALNTDDEQVLENALADMTAELDNWGFEEVSIGVEIAANRFSGTFIVTGEYWNQRAHKMCSLIAKFIRFKYGEYFDIGLVETEEIIEELNVVKY